MVFDNYMKMHLLGFLKKIGLVNAHYQVFVDKETGKESTIVFIDHKVVMWDEGD